MNALPRQVYRIIEGVPHVVCQSLSPLFTPCWPGFSGGWKELDGEESLCRCTRFYH